MEADSGMCVKFREENVKVKSDAETGNSRMASVTRGLEAAVWYRGS